MGGASSGVPAEPAAVEIEMPRAKSDDSPPHGQLSNQPSAFMHEESVQDFSSMRSVDDEMDQSGRFSRVSTANLPSLEEIQLEADAANQADAQAGLKRPKGYIKLGSKVPFRVPRKPEDLSPSWMTAALRFKGMLSADVGVTAVQCKPIGEGGGVMGVIALVTISYDGETSAPERLVAKFSPQGKAPLPKLVVKAIFMAEAHYYNDFSVGDGGMPRAECYLALWDRRRSKPTFCMLIENMMPAVCFTRVSACDDVEKLMAAVSGMARLHARWWQAPKAPPLEWCLHPVTDFGGLVLNGFVRTTKLGLAALGKVYGDTYKPILDWIPQIHHRHKFILEELFKPPLTLTHGDAHIENIFFDSRFSGGASFIDFGNMMFSQGMYDIAFFTVNSLEPEVRRRVEKDLVEHYHACLVANGVTNYSAERAWSDYVLNLWRPLISVCAIAPSIEVAHRHGTGLFAEKPTEGDAQMRLMYEKLNERIVAALTDHHWLDRILQGSQSCGLCSCISFCY